MPLPTSNATCRDVTRCLLRVTSPGILGRLAKHSRTKGRISCFEIIHVSGPSPFPSSGSDAILNPSSPICVMETAQGKLGGGGQQTKCKPSTMLERDVTGATSALHA
jgi:hypothetical protein